MKFLSSSLSPARSLIIVFISGRNSLL
jgi:hypothetical protein